MELLKAQVSVPLRILALDLLDDSTFRVLEEILRKERPSISFLVNNAGRGKYISFEKEAEKDMAGEVVS